MTSGRILLKFHRKGNDITRNELSFSKPKNDLSTFALTMDMVEMYTVSYHGNLAGDVLCIVLAVVVFSALWELRYDLAVIDLRQDGAATQWAM